MDERERIERRTNYIMKRVKDLIELGRSTFYNPEWRSRIDEADILGVIVAKYCRWEKTKILKVINSTLEDANFHTLNAQFEALCNGAKLITPSIEGQAWRKPPT